MSRWDKISPDMQFVSEIVGVFNTPYLCRCSHLIMASGILELTWPGCLSLGFVHVASILMTFHDYLPAFRLAIKAVPRVASTASFTPEDYFTMEICK